MKNDGVYDNIEFIKVKINEIKGNPDNPRIIKDDDFEKLVNSIKSSPWMLHIRPIVVDENMIILGGNQRWRACQTAKLKVIPIVKASSLTYEQKVEFIYKDNLNSGQWDWDAVANNMDVQKLNDWGFKVPTFGNKDILSDVNSGTENDEWVGMPEFEAKSSTLKIVVSFENEADREEFAEKHKLDFVKKQANCWMTRYPFIDRIDLVSVKFD